MGDGGAVAAGIGGRHQGSLDLPAGAGQATFGVNLGGRIWSRPANPTLVSPPPASLSLGHTPGKGGGLGLKKKPVSGNWSGHIAQNRKRGQSEGAINEPARVRVILQKSLKLQDRAFLGSETQPAHFWFASHFKNLGDAMRKKMPTVFSWNFLIS